MRHRHASGSSRQSFDEARIAHRHAAIGARNVGPPDQDVHDRRAALQRSRSAVHGGRADADHRDTPSGEAVIVVFVGGVRPAISRQILREVRQIWAAEPVAPCCQNDVACPLDLRTIGGIERQDDMVRMRHDAVDPALAANLQPENRAVPAKVVHPLQARDLAQCIPGGTAELSLEPGAERERGNAQRRPGEPLWRAKGLHPRRRCPRAFPALRPAIEDDRLDPLETQGCSRREPRHPATDHGDIEDGLAIDGRFRHPPRGRQLEKGEVVRNAVVESVETSRCHVIRRDTHAAHHHC